MFLTAAACASLRFGGRLDLDAAFADLAHTGSGGLGRVRSCGGQERTARLRPSRWKRASALAAGLLDDGGAAAGEHPLPSRRERDRPNFLFCNCNTFWTVWKLRPVPDFFFHDDI